MKYCTKCGTEILDNSKFCEKCGNKINEISTGKSRRFTYVGIGVAIVLAVVIVMVSIGHESNMKYKAGSYTSSIQLNDGTVDVKVVVDDNYINSITLVNLDEYIAIQYPLMQSAFDNLVQQIYEKQSLEDISYEDSNQYTSMVLLQAIKEALDKAVYMKE